MKSNIKVIIPALNEENAISKVIKEIPEFVDEIIVIDNGSNDNTSVVAKAFGATVLHEIKKDMDMLFKRPKLYSKFKDRADVIVFLDGDYSDYPNQMPKLISPIINDNFDFVLGSRKQILSEKGAMNSHQRFGNWLATTLMSLLLNPNSQI